MDARKMIEFLGVLEKLKCNTRHSLTSSGRTESVAEHSWRLAVMAMLAADSFPELDMNKVIKMCLVHDFGEAVTGDIPAFVKTEADTAVENSAVASLLSELPEAQWREMNRLFTEMTTMNTAEAKLCKALDKCEALLQHNEADISSWLPLEYDLQMTYGQAECDCFDFTRTLRDELAADSRAKIQDSNK